jgi:hypothetical protein
MEGGKRNEEVIGARCMAVQKRAMAFLLVNLMENFLQNWNCASSWGT